MRRIGIVLLCLMLSGCAWNFRRGSFHMGDSMTCEKRFRMEAKIPESPETEPAILYHCDQGFHWTGPISEAGKEAVKSLVSLPRTIAGALFGF